MLKDGNHLTRKRKAQAKEGNPEIDLEMLRRVSNIQ